MGTQKSEYSSRGVPSKNQPSHQAFPGIDLVALGIISRIGDQAQALLDIRPFAEDERQWWVVADLTPGLDGRREPMRSEYVLGIAPASLSLIHLTVPIKAERALDIGTGCGIQSLHLADRVGVMSAHSGRIKREFIVDLPRPRDLSVKRSRAFTDLEVAIWSELELSGD